MNEPEIFTDLYNEPLTQSRDIDEIAAALSNSLKDINDIPKTAFAHKHKYAPLELYTPMVRKACINNGLFLLQSPLGLPGRLGLTTMITHSSGQWIKGEASIPFYPKSHPNPIQAAGAIYTYLRRYSLGAFFSISPHGDDYDAVEAAVKPEVKPASKKLLAKLSKAADGGPKSLTEAFNGLSDKVKESLTSAQVAQFKATARAVSDGN
jgi:hypothetical protein